MHHVGVWQLEEVLPPDPAYPLSSSHVETSDPDGPQGEPLDLSQQKTPAEVESDSYGPLETRLRSQLLVPFFVFSRVLVLI